MFDRPSIRRLVDGASQQLGGEWVLLGGAMISLLLDAGRTTQDIDLVPLNDGNEARHSLMQLARSQGLPIESVNSAAGFFLRNINGWQDQLKVLVQTPRCTIYVPTSQLMLALKIERLSERDYSDCVAVINASHEAIDVSPLCARLDELIVGADAQRAKRISDLRRLLLGALKS